MLISSDEMRPTEQRFADRVGHRQANEERLKKGVLDVDSQERIAKRLMRLTEAAAAAPEETTLRELGLERILGKSDLMAVSYLERGARVGRTVARIEIRNRAGQVIGYGTGFLVGQGLLLTNNHVLSSVQDAATSRAEFDYADDAAGKRLPAFQLDLSPETCFLTDREFDFTLVAVRDPDGRLATIGWNPLIAQEGKAIIGEYLSIVQHPNGQLKQIALRENRLIDVLDNFLHYQTDTAPGSSGSPVFNDQWEVVALHHMGVPQRNGAGQILTRDGIVWHDGMDDALIQWKANEGVRVSQLMARLVNLAKDRPERRLIDAMLQGKPPDRPESLPIQSALPLADRGKTIPVAPAGVARWVIPLEVSVSLGCPTSASAPTPVSAAPPSSAPSAGRPTPAEEKISIDPDYSTREGYDPEFLGQNALEVPLPALSPAAARKVARNREAGPGQDDSVLPYHHFSLVMNRDRKLAFFTAVNIDGTKARAIERERDVWILDPRLADDEQAGDDIYESNPLDRGHLVRRLDPAWGDSTKLAKVANDDTFHFTNCTPQHENFNQRAALWAGLEDYILKNAKAQDLKLSVFTGPVLGKSDPPYRRIRLPLQFWKVVVMATEAGKPSATGYLLSQRALVEDLEEEFQFGAYRTYQVSVRRIEQLTGLKFGALAAHDPMKAAKPEEEEAATAVARELSGYEEIRFA